jgi:hypothetical protein
MKPWIHYVAFVVFCHGLIYVGIGSVLPGPIPAWKGTSWLLGGALTGEPLRLLVVALHVTAGVAIVAASVAMAFDAWVPGWWRSFAIGGALLGVAAFAVFWDGQTTLLIEEGAIGALVSLALVAVAVIFPLT